MSEENKLAVDVDETKEKKKKNRRAHIRKRPKPDQRKELEDEGEDIKIGKRNKQTKREGEEGKEVESLIFAIQGDKILQTQDDQGATRLLETETEHAIDARQFNLFFFKNKI